MKTTTYTCEHCGERIALDSSFEDYIFCYNCGYEMSKSPSNSELSKTFWNVGGFLTFVSVLLIIYVDDSLCLLGGIITLLCAVLTYSVAVVFKLRKEIK